MSDRDAAPLLARVFGNPNASQSDVEALIDRMVSSGAKQRVEERIEALLAAADAALESAPFSPDARTLLRGAALALSHREK